MLFDLFFLAYFLIVCITSAKKGFIRSLVEIIGFVIATILAYVLSRPIAEAIYVHFFRPTVVSAIAGQIGQITSAGSIADRMDIILGSVSPAFQELAGAFGVSVNTVGAQLSEWLGESAQQAAQTIADNIIGPIITGVSGIFIIFILFMVFSSLAKIAAKSINKLVGAISDNFVNKLLGGLLGAGKAMLVTMVFCTVLSICVCIADESFSAFFSEQMQSSFLFSAVYNSNPFVI